MITVCDILYATQIPILDILRDLDIVTTYRKNIEGIIDGCDNGTLAQLYKPPSHISKIFGRLAHVIGRTTDIINAYNIGSILPILDKLMMTHVINAILELYIVPSTKHAMLTINHTSRDNIVEIYACGSVYNLVYNYDMGMCPYDRLVAAISRGLIVRNIVVYPYVKDSYIRSCTSVVRATIYWEFKITSFAPFEKSLRDLWIESSKWVGDDVLRNCTQIEILNARDNRRVTTCKPFANTLIKLVVSGEYCGMCDDGLVTCHNIRELYACDNAKITTCAPFAKTLVRLNARWSCGINDAGLKSCFSIKILNASNNPKITTCAPFAKSLIVLYAPDSSGINDAGLSSCYSITELCAGNNPNITTCAPFAKSLISLIATGKCGIADTGLSLCESIITLVACYNSKITTCAPFAKSLKYLRATFNCGINDTGLKLCSSIEEFYVYNNPKITTFAPFARSLIDASVSRNSSMSPQCNALRERLQKRAMK